jgi:hypothetical protein
MSQLVPPAWRLLIVVLLALPCVHLAAGEVVIADFTAADNRKGLDWNADNVEVTIGPRLVTERGNVLKLVAKQDDYPGIAFYAPMVPRDWSTFESLSLVVWSNDERDMAIRIDDHKSAGYNSRFNGSTHLLKGRNLVQLPVATIGKAIDVKNIKLLNFFVDHPPANLTLWIDDVKLGSLEAERTPFIPYAERLDHQPQMDVVSPHLPFARNLAGGPLNAFMIAGVKQGREVVELMQRVDLAPKVLSWDREWGANTWGFGDAYGQRGSGLDCALMQRYLASSMQGPEKFEVLLLTTPMGWNRFGPAARQAILERVRDRGEGLVLLMPFTGERGQPWPEDLRALSALIDADADWVDDSGTVRQPGKGREYGERWQVVGDHPITAGVPFESLPQTGMQVQTYQLAPGAQALVTLTPRNKPVIAVRQVGKGRVVTFATVGWSLTPLMDTPDGYADRPAYRYWETWYSLLSRSALWAAGRPLARAGAAKDLAVTGDHADPWYTVRQWSDAQGKVTDWELRFADPTPELRRFALQVPVAVDPGAAIPVRFTVPEGLTGVTWSAMLGELGDGRWRTLATTSVEGGAVSFPSTRVRQPIALVRVLGKRGEQIVAEGRAEVVVTPKSVWDDYETLTWYEQGLPFLSDVEMARMREFGLSGNTASPGNPNEWRRLFRGGMRIHPVGFADGLHAKDIEGQMRQWRESQNKDRTALVRRPSFAEKSFADAQRAKTAKVAAEAKPFGPLSYITSDETSLTSYTAEFDLDEHANNVAAFRAKLQAQFGDIATLNAAYGTTLASFDAVVPVTGAEAKDGKIAGAAALWNAWRSHNDDAWAGVFRLYGDALKSGDSAARLSVSGTQEQAVFNGIDWAKLSPELGAVSGYGGRWQELQRLCFGAADLRATPWCAYGRSGRAVDHQVWTNLLAGGDGMAMFWWFSLRNPDLTLCQSGKDYQRVIVEMRGGIGKQIMQSTRQFSPVAVLWSATSQRAAWLRGKFEDFKKAESQVMTALYAAGHDPVLVSETQVANGELSKRGIRALILPMTLALGRGEKKGDLPLLPAVTKLLDAGGAVVVTDLPELDGFLRPAELPDAVAKRLTRFDVAALAGVLSKANATPHVALTPSTGITPVLHAVDGAGGARILTLVRDPVGTKEVVGADGVPYIERDTSGGAEIQPVTVGVAGLGKVIIIDCRSGKLVPVKDGTITVNVQAGDGHPLAAMPYTVSGLEAKASAANDDLTITWQVRANQAIISGHVMHVEVRGKDGKVLRHLVRNVTTGTDGAGSLMFPLAVEDGTELTVHLRDALTGLIAIIAIK